MPSSCRELLRLQQLLPFTVLKPKISATCCCLSILHVATALTVYGIETIKTSFTDVSNLLLVATALTVYGIETLLHTRLLLVG